MFSSARQRYVLKGLSIVCILVSLTNIIFSNPPEPVTDLRVVEVRFRQVTLSWTVPKSTEPVSFYQIRVSTFLTLSNETEWSQNSSVSDYPYRILISSSDLGSGPIIYRTITGLKNGVGYYFAIKSSTYTETPPLDSITAWSSVQTGSSYQERYALPQNSQPEQFLPIWPVASVVVTSQTVITFDWDDAYDPDLPYGDSLKYELYWSTNSLLQTELVPSLNYPVSVIFNLTTSYAEVPTNYFLDNTTYYWRVKVVDSENYFRWSFGGILGRESVFITNHTPEPPSSFNLISPILSSTVTTPVTFRWGIPSDPDPQDSVKYYLYISSQGRNYGFSLQVAGITWSSYTLSAVFGGFVENATYWWYVVAEDNFGLKSFSPTWWFMINDHLENPQPNFLVSPGTTIYEPIDIIFTLNPTFYWTPSYDPDPYSKTVYQLFISSYSDSPDVINSVYFSQVIYTTYFYLPQQLLDDTTYFWRVKIWDETYYPSEEFVWSSTVAWFYTCSILNSAELIFPQDNFTTSDLLPVFRWQPNFVGYEINFASQTLVYWTGNTTVTVSGLSPYTTYYIPSAPLINNSIYHWQVIAHSNSPLLPLVSSSTVIFKFYVHNSSPSTFDLVTPSGCIITSSQVILKWSTSTDDDPTLTYTIVYSTNNFLTFVSSSEIFTTEYTLDNLQDNTTYYWYVKAVDPWGHTTLSNQTFYFIVNNIPEEPTRFNLTSPSNNSLLTNTYTTFYWEASFDPDPFESVFYLLYISSDVEFRYVSFSTKTLNTWFFIPKGFLQVNLTYYWIVVASSTGSGFTIANSTFVFRIINTPPMGLGLISPQNYTLITSTPVVFKWSPAYDPQGDEFHYRLYYTTQVAQTGAWLSTNCVILSSLEYLYTLHQVVDDTTYYWYITAVDTYNNVTSIGPFLFWTSYENQPPTVPTIIRPVNDDVVRLPYVIKWTTSVDYDLFDEVKYTLQLSTDVGFSTVITITSSITTTEFKFCNFELNPSVYFLKVIAFDKHGGSNVDVVSFRIEQYHIAISSPPNNEVIKSLPVKFYFSKVEPKFVSDKVSYRLVYSSYTDYRYKVEIDLQENHYEITTVPMYPSVYFWYVQVYYNDNYAGCSDTFSFVIPDIVPPAPSNLQVSVQPYGTVLTWDKVDIENLWGYRIYSGYELERLTLIGFTSTTTYVDIYGIGKNLFYMVSSVNQFGNESKENKCVRIYNDEIADVYLSPDSKLVFTVSPKEKLADVKIERLTQEETQKYIYVYKISANKPKLHSFAEIRFVKPSSEVSKYSVEHYDGYNWIVFPSEDLVHSVVIKTQYLGKYRLVKITEQLPDELTIIGCSPKKRIITPNNDGKNDYIEFQYKVGSYIEGEVFDVNLQRVCRLKRRGNEKNILYFDGKNDDGKLLPPGIYIYEIKTEGKIFTGTVVIKY